MFSSNKPILIVTLSALLLVGVQNQCGAKNSQLDQNQNRKIYSALTNPSNNQPQKSKGMSAAAARAKDGEFTHMATPPAELPGVSLPPANMGKYQFGLQKPSHGSTVLNLSYQMKLPDSSVLAMYRDSLKSSGWAVSQSSKDQISGSFHGNTCTIQTAAINSPGEYQSTMSVFYSFKDR